MKKKLFLIFCFLSTNIFGAGFEIDSNPTSVDVFVKNTKNNKSLKIGSTPFKIDLDTLTSKYANSDVFIVELKKEGFDPYRILLTKTGQNDVKLFVNLEIQKNIKQIKLIDAYTNELFEIQRLIRIKNYDSALLKLSSLEKKFPHYSTIYELTGSTLYLSKNFSKSLSYYRKAFAKNTDNIDAYKMKEYLEKKLGIRNKK